MLPLDYSFTPHYLTLGSGRRLHYLDEGHGEAVILVHGNPTWSYYYRNLARHLSESFRVIVPDHLGCGLSDKPQDYEYTLANHIDNLAALVTHLDVQTGSMVIHDWGGPIGLGVFARGSLELKNLVILNTAAFRSTMIPLRIRICRWPIIGRFLVQGLNGFAVAALYMAVEKKMDKQVAQGYVHPYDCWSNRIALYEFVKDIPLEPNHRSYQDLVRIEEKLELLLAQEVPVAIHWGGKDFCFNDHFYRQWLKRLPDAEKCYYPDWGHYVLEDGRGVIEPVLKEFLSRKR